MNNEFEKLTPADSAEEGMSSEVVLNKSAMPVNIKKDFYPMCIVWSPIPLLSWLCPVIGHLGIVTSDGKINDFGGPYFVNRHNSRTAFGAVTKYWPISARELSTDRITVEAWDRAIEESSCAYDEMMHNLICNNCHSHVARALNNLRFKQVTYWNTVVLICYMIRYGQFVSFGRWLKTYLGFFCMIGLTLFFVFMSKSDKR
jgi:hypothetical protein